MSRIGFIHSWRRCVLHLGVGFITVLMFRHASRISWMDFIADILVACVFNLGFFIYEIIEDWRIRDFAFKDIQGHLFGIAITWIIWRYLFG